MRKKAKGNECVSVYVGERERNGAPVVACLGCVV